MKEYKLPIYDIVVLYDHKSGAGRIESSFKKDGIYDERDRVFYDTMEAFILACACAGIDISTPNFIRAIETTIDAIDNNFDGEINQ